ncbi:MAG: SAF domain-containing protein [Actinobacteria bacterium]|nr:SAF domain-containing protein [Actinomycetota bacterium]
MAVRADGEARNGHRPGPAVARRRSVPGGRAVLGGLLVAAAVVGLFWASTRAGSVPKQTFVVARHAIAPGTRLTTSDLARLALDLPPSLAGRAFHDPRALAGATVIAPLAPGELIQASAVVAKPSAPASREITFAVPRATLGSNLEEGERIDIVATYGSGADAFSTVVLRQALVVGLDRGGSRVGDQGDVAITVAVDDPSDAVVLAHAVQLAKLTVVRATGAEPAPNGAASPTFRQPVPAPSPSSAAAGKS